MNQLKTFYLFICELLFSILRKGETNMKIKIQSEVQEEKETLTEHVERRLQFSIGRFVDRIDSVRIRISDVNGPRGGVDQRCSILLKLKLGKEIFVESTETSWEAAVDLASDRVGRSVSRTLQLQRALRFQSGMVPREGVMWS